MADLARIKNNVAKMAAQNAPEEDIDGYIASEGVTIEDVRNFRPQAAEPESQMSKDLRSELSAMTQNPSKAMYDQLPEWQKPIQAAQDIFDLGLNGVSLGFANKGAAAVRSAVTGESYEDELEGMRSRTQAARDRAQTAGMVAEIGGGVATPYGLARRGVTLAGRFGTGAMTGAKGIAARAGLMGAEGAAYGGLSATGNDTDLGEGVAIGAGAGAGIPIVAGIGRAVARPLVDAVRARTNPAGYAAEKVGERLSDTMTPQQAANRMQAAPGSSLADVGGENVRGLLRTAANIPGPARQSINARLVMRQFGQGDRLKSAISKTFADPDGYLAAKDEIAAEAQRLARPLYNQAYAQPVHFSEKLEGVLTTPAGKAALRKAEELAANEGIPFQQLFANVADDGSASIRRVPDTRGWDYIKRAMDDMIDGQTDSISRKVTNEGRILTNLKNTMLSEVDKYNPAYKAARQAYAGQAQLDEALEAGRDVFKSSPEAFKRTVADMSDAQKATARIGAAETLRAQIDAAGVTNNSLLRIFSKPQQLQNLRTLFETPEKFAEFRKTIFAEARKRATYERVRGNSTTVQQAADMAEAGGLREGFDFAKNAVTGGPINATLNFIGSRLRMLGGMTPEVADQVARRLMSANPNAPRLLLNELTAIQRAKISGEEKSQAVQSLIARSLAVGGAMSLSTNAAAQGDTSRPMELNLSVPMR